FSPEVAALAVSLETVLGRSVSRPALAAALIRSLDRMASALMTGELEPYRAAYRRNCVTLGRPVQMLSAGGVRESAFALDVDEAFGLVVRDSAGAVRTVRTGEVSVRGLSGYVE